MAFSQNQLAKYLPLTARKEPGQAILAVMSAIAAAVAFGDALLSLVVLYASGFVGSTLATSLRQPPLIGVLLAGFVVRNTLPPSAGLVDPLAAALLRNLALALIMLRAGLGLDMRAVISQPLRVGLLAVGPCFVEVAAITLLASPFLCYGPAYLTALMADEEATLAMPGDDFTPQVPLDALLVDSSLPSSRGLPMHGGNDGESLQGFDRRWAMLLGFCLAAVSPAVVVPLLLDLQRKRFGAEHGVPSVLIAAASLNAVVAIVGFGVCLNLILSDDGATHSSSFDGAVVDGNGVSTSASNPLPWLGHSLVRSAGFALFEVCGGLGLGAAVGWAASLALESATSRVLRRASLFPSLARYGKDARGAASTRTSAFGGGGGGGGVVLPPSALPTYAPHHHDQQQGRQETQPNSAMSRKYLFRQEQHRDSGSGEEEPNDNNSDDDGHEGFASPSPVSSSPLSTSSRSAPEEEQRQRRGGRQRRGRGSDGSDGSGGSGGGDDGEDRWCETPVEKCAAQLEGPLAACLVACAGALVLCGGGVVFGGARAYGGATLAATCVGAAVKASLREDENEDGVVVGALPLERSTAAASVGGGDDGSGGKRRGGFRAPTTIAAATASAAVKTTAAAVIKASSSLPWPKRRRAAETTTAAAVANRFDADASSAARLALERAEARLGFWWGGGGGGGGCLGGCGQLALFALLGSAIDASKIEPAVAAAAALLVLAGLLPRALAAFLCGGSHGCMAGNGAWCQGSTTHSSSSSSSSFFFFFSSSSASSSAFSSSPPSSSPSSLSASWTARERLFVMVCWCPKATVQAALGTLALDALLAKGATAQQNRETEETPPRPPPYGTGSEETSSGGSISTDELFERRSGSRVGIGSGWEADVRRAEVLLTVVAVSILVTAPLFASLVGHLGPKLLERSCSVGGEDNEDNDSTWDGGGSEEGGGNRGSANGDGITSFAETERGISHSKVEGKGGRGGKSDVGEKVDEEKEDQSTYSNVEASATVTNNRGRQDAAISPTRQPAASSSSRGGDGGAITGGHQHAQHSAPALAAARNDEFDLLGLRHIVPALPPPPGTRAPPRQKR